MLVIKVGSGGGVSYILITKIFTSSLTGAFFPYDYLCEGEGLETIANDASFNYNQGICTLPSLLTA